MEMHTSLGSSVGNSSDGRKVRIEGLALGAGLSSEEDTSGSASLLWHPLIEHPAQAVDGSECPLCPRCGPHNVLSRLPDPGQWPAGRFVERPVTALLPQAVPIGGHRTSELKQPAADTGCLSAAAVRGQCMKHMGKQTQLQKTSWQDWGVEEDARLDLRIGCGQIPVILSPRKATALARAESKPLFSPVQMTRKEPTQKSFKTQFLAQEHDPVDTILLHRTLADQGLKSGANDAGQNLGPLDRMSASFRTLPAERPQDRNGLFLGDRYSCACAEQFGSCDVGRWGREEFVQQGGMDEKISASMGLGSISQLNVSSGGSSPGAIGSECTSAARLARSVSQSQQANRQQSLEMMQVEERTRGTSCDTFVEVEGSFERAEPSGPAVHHSPKLSRGVQPESSSGRHEPTPMFQPLPPMFVEPPRFMSSLLPSCSKLNIPRMAVLQNCGMESQMVDEYADSHQEISLMLETPGVTEGRAAMLTLEQAGNILRAITEPLASLKVGRLTRSLGPKPGQLQSTEDVGSLTLWLSPLSELRVVFHLLKNPVWDETHEAGTTESASMGGKGSRPAGEELPGGVHEVFSFMEASEELACVSADFTSNEDGTGVRLELLDEDASGRSFKLIRRSKHGRQKKDLADRLAEEKMRAGGRTSSETAKLSDLLRACSTEPEREEYFFFWIAEKSLSTGRQVLQTMNTLLNTPPTLSEKSGVPEAKLEEVYHWFSETARALAFKEVADVRNGDAPRVSQVSIQSESAVDEPSDPERSNNLQGYLPLPSHLLASLNPTHPLDSLFHLGSSIPLDFGRDAKLRNAESGTQCIGEACASSAIANFLVSDKRFGLTILSTASVTVAAGLEAASDSVDVEETKRAVSEQAHQLAKKRAEAGACAEAERLGRRRLEELAAEQVSKSLVGDEPERRVVQENGRGQRNTLKSSSFPKRTSPVPIGAVVRTANPSPDSDRFMERAAENWSRHSSERAFAETLALPPAEEAISNTSVLQSQTMWRPRASRSVRGWGGTDLQFTGRELFNSSSPPGVADPVLPHEAAFGCHGKQANVHHAKLSPPSVVQRQCLPASFPPEAVEIRKSTNQPSRLQWPDGDVSAIHSSGFPCNDLPSLDNHWLWWHEAWRHSREPKAGPGWPVSTGSPQFYPRSPNSLRSSTDPRQQAWAFGRDASLRAHQNSPHYEIWQEGMAAAGKQLEAQDGLRNKLARPVKQDVAVAVEGNSVTGSQNWESLDLEGPDRFGNHHGNNWRIGCQQNPADREETKPEFGRRK